MPWSKPNNYDPLRHLLRMGMRVEFVPDLPEAGLYYHDERRVEVRAGMSPVKERCVLAHEAAHAEYGHQPSADYCAVAKMERLANAMAGRRLIDYHKMAKLQADGADERTMCRELGVVPVVLRAYLWLSSPAWRLAACITPFAAAACGIAMDLLDSLDGLVSMV